MVEAKCVCDLLAKGWPAVSFSLETHVCKRELASFKLARFDQDRFVPTHRFILFVSRHPENLEF
jgi:hypothetical protein